MKLPSPDLVVAGKYCLEGELATGGMGSVWVARHLDLDIPVAIKFMGIECASSEEGRTRFEREAKAAAFLQSPHVVNVLDYGVDDGLPYMAMELLVGEDLEDRLHRQGRLSLDETLTILTQAAKALRRAQDLGIVHRDIKPANFFLATHDDGEFLKILDFGIAKETGPVLLAKGSNTGQIIGSPDYMSPEHVRGARDIDHRADLWSLAVILFQAVTGKLPFRGENVGDVMAKILTDPIPRPTEVASDLPPALDTFFEKALARDRTQRFQSAREMAEAFAEIVRSPDSPRWSLTTPPPPVVAASLASSGPESAASRRDSSLAPSEADTLSLPAAQPASVKASPPRKWGAFAAAIAVVAVGGVLLLVMRRSDAPASPANGAAIASDAAQPPPPAPAASAIASAATTAQPDPTAEGAQPGPSSSASGKPAQASQPVSGKGQRGAAPKSSGSSKVKPPSWGF